MRKKSNRALSSNWVGRDKLASRPRSSDRVFDIATVYDGHALTTSVNGVLQNTSAKRAGSLTRSARSLITDLEHVTWAVDGVGRTIDDVDKSDPKDHAHQRRTRLTHRPGLPGRRCSRLQFRSTLAPA